MALGKTSCVYRGNTFYCDYDVAGIGADREVRVCYNGEELCARTDGRPDEDVARTLLGELVTLESIAITVAEGSQMKAFKLGDARERRAA